LGEDGVTITMVSFGPSQVQGAENIDLEGAEFGVAVSTGPSYGSQLEQVQDMVTDLCSRVPALAPILLPLVVRRMAIPESEDVIQALNLSLPPNVQAMLAQKGDKGAQLAQAMSQAQQAGQQVQQLQAQLQQVMGALKQSQEALATRGAIQERDNETKRQIAEIQAQNDRIIKQMDKDLSLRNDLILQGAKAQDAEELQAQSAGHTIITGFAGRMGTPAPVRPFDHT
jgi:exonuclease VII large subunit